MAKSKFSEVTPIRPVVGRDQLGDVLQGQLAPARSETKAVGAADPAKPKREKRERRLGSAKAADDVHTFNLRMPYSTFERIEAVLAQLPYRMPLHSFIAQAVHDALAKAERENP